MATSVQYHTMDESKQVRERKQVVIDRELDRIRAEHGTVTVPLFVESARDPNHPTHKYFEWDDAKAGEQYRKHQALQMIMASRMVAEIQSDGTVIPTAKAHRAEVRRMVSSYRGEGFKYRPDAMANDDDREAFKRRKAEQLRGWCRSTADIEEFSALRETILQTLDAVVPREESEEAVTTAAA